jgi:hypothetical protein
MMQWPWNRIDEQPEPNHTDPIPDGDQVLRPGQPHWSTLLGEWIDEPTQQLPIVERPRPRDGR